HISFDMWTSTNSLALLGIVDHWVAAEGGVQSALLGLHRIFGQHSGKNMSQAVLTIICEYALETKMGYFMLDNASANDVCVAHICEELNLIGRKAQQRLCCAGHIINLIVRAFLFGSNQEAFEIELYGI